MRWSATLHSSTTPNGSHGSTPGWVNPAPGPGAHGIGVRAASRLWIGCNAIVTGSSIRSTGTSVSGMPSSSP